MTRTVALPVRRIALMLAACLCVVVVGFLHTHCEDGSEQAEESHFCFACSLASSVDVEAAPHLPQPVEAPALPALEAESDVPDSPPLIVYSARAPPSLVS